MAGDKYLGDEAATQANHSNKAMTLNKLLGLMECGIEPKFKDGAWTIEVPDRVLNRSEEVPIDNGVIAQLRHYHLAEVVKRENGMTLELAKLT